jgi:TldD protein
MTPKYLRWIWLVTILLPGAATVNAAVNPETKSARDVILSAMDKELQRSMSALKMEGYDAPYFLSFAIREQKRTSLTAAQGTIVGKGGDHNRMVYIETRVGDYALDNTELESGRYQFSSGGALPYTSYQIPLDNNEAAIRRVLWYLVDSKYKQSLEQYLKKKGEKIFAAEKEHVDDFSRESAVVNIGSEVALDFDAEEWGGIMRRLSLTLAEPNGLYGTRASITAQKIIDLYINSEGSRIVTESVQYSLSFSASIRAEDGAPLENFRSYNTPQRDELPTEEKLQAAARQVIEELQALQKAPELPPDTYPAILDPSVTGVIFHEAIGHRLEGERQKRESSGQTFKGKIGEVIIPEFLSVVDDPTMVEFENQALSGHYAFDNEGVPASRVELISNGELNSYLMSRTPVKGVAQSNGHGRSDGTPFRGDPVARMGNLMVLADGGLSDADLKVRLMAECKKQGKAQGLIIRNIVGGETNTRRGGFQAFKQSPVLVYLVDAETGEEILVRGVDIVGTPLSSIRKIVAAGNNYGIFNGVCGAESGFVPVSTVAPAVLTLEVELQKTSGKKQRGPLLDPPALR